MTCSSIWMPDTGTIAAEIIGHQPFFTFIGPDERPSTTHADSVNIPVEGSAAEMLLSLSWKYAWYTQRVELRNPSGGVVAPFHSDLRHVVWRVASPG